MIKLNDSKILEFLFYSNQIEREYSYDALIDSVKAWNVAYEYIDYKDTKISIEFICKIHKILMQRLHPEIAGKLRDCAVFIGGEYKEDEGQDSIHKKLQAWCDYVNIQNNMSVLQVKQAHVAFEKLHPFQDGNGRIGRILMNILCIQFIHQIIIIKTGVEQAEYYNWFSSEKYYNDELMLKMNLKTYKQFKDEKEKEDLHFRLSVDEMLKDSKLIKEVFKNGDT